MNKRVLIVGYPKSGNTWLGYMLTYILGARYCDYHRPDTPPTGKQETLRKIGWMGTPPHSTLYSRVFKTHDSRGRFPDRTKYPKVIHIVRDPRDAAVSFYYYERSQRTKGRRAMPAGLQERPLVRALTWKRMVWRVSHEWPAHTRSWMNCGGIVVRYEDLSQHCAETLARVCSYLEVPLEARIIRDAIESFSFDKLSGGRKTGEENANAFYRKGVVGDHRNHFDAVDLRIFRLLAGNVMKALGYLG